MHSKRLTTLRNKSVRKNKYIIWSHLYVKSNEQNKQTNKIEVEAWTQAIDRQQSEGRKLGELDEGKWRDWEKNHVFKTQSHRQQSGDSQRESRDGARWRWTKVGKIGMERDWGAGCTMQCADNVLLSCTLKTCMVLWNNVNPINLILKSSTIRTIYWSTGFVNVA